MYGTVHLWLALVANMPPSGFIGPEQGHQSEATSLPVFPVHFTKMASRTLLLQSKHYIRTGQLRLQPNSSTFRHTKLRSCVPSLCITIRLRYDYDTMATTAPSSSNFSGSRTYSCIRCAERKVKYVEYYCSSCRNISLNWVHMRCMLY